MKIDLSKYNSTAEKIAYLVSNKKDILELSKSIIKHADAFGSNLIEANVCKSINTNFSDDLSTGIIKRTIIGNTYNWLDSHGDVHLDGLFSKSINERMNKIWHLHDHEQKITAKVGTPVKIYEKQVNWIDLGINKAGSTTALFMDSNISKTFNEQIFNEYLNKQIDQHSVGMNYVQMELAVNDAEYKDEFTAWNKYIHLVGNRQKAEDNGYFWAVKEAKLIEISAVLEGSNELTPTVINYQPENKTTDKKINYDYLIENLK